MKKHKYNEYDVVWVCLKSWNTKILQYVGPVKILKLSTGRETGNPEYLVAANASLWNGEKFFIKESEIVCKI